MRKASENQYVLLPVGGQDSLGLVVPGQPVDSALDEDQTELSILVLQVQKQHVMGMKSFLNACCGFFVSPV